MELSELKVETADSLTLPYEEVIVMPIGDVQWGAEGCDKSRLKHDIEWGLKHNAYFLGMGEYLDIASPSNRAKIKSADLYDSVQDAIEEIVQQKIDEFMQVVRGSEGRWLGLLEGHHYYEFRDGTTTDTRIAQRLKTSFLGTCAYVRLKFARQNSKQTCTIWCHHGAGGGVKTSAPLNRLENLMPHFEADIYLIGHQHKKVGAPIDQMYMTKKKPYRISYKTKLIAGTGGYLRGYLQGNTQGRLYPRGCYIERFMRPPVALGCILVYIRPVRRDKEERIDLNLAV
jgi:hypothetical protein